MTKEEINKLLSNKLSKIGMGTRCRGCLLDIGHRPGCSYDPRQQDVVWVPLYESHKNEIRLIKVPPAVLDSWLNSDGDGNLVLYGYWGPAIFYYPPGGWPEGLVLPRWETQDEARKYFSDWVYRYFPQYHP
jgi:hypothetical protein